jgi:hypothetical protein
MNFQYVYHPKIILANLPRHLYSSPILFEKRELAAETDPKQSLPS